MCSLRRLKMWGRGDKTGEGLLLELCKWCAPLYNKDRGWCFCIDASRLARLCPHDSRACADPNTMYSVVVGCGTAQPPSHTFWLQSQYKLRVVKVTGNLPEHHEASSAKNSLAKQKRRCHCFSLEPSKTSVHNCREHGTHLHTRHRGSNMAATYTVQYHANAHCKLLLYKLASCVW